MKANTPSTAFFKSSPRFFCGLGRRTALIFAAAMVANSAHAIFHAWSIREIYTDSTGNLQFIELFSSAAGQTVLNGQQIDRKSVV